MRLRRETGDFQIRINPSNGTNAIRTGLSAEDFAGELININGTIEPVLSVSESEGVVTAKTASYTVTYNKETGAVTSSEGGAGGSGGSGGSRLVIEFEYGYIESMDLNGYVFSGPLPAGLTPADFIDAIFVVRAVDQFQSDEEQTLFTDGVYRHWWSSADEYKDQLEAADLYAISVVTPSYSPDDGYVMGGALFYYNPYNGHVAPQWSELISPA